MIPAENALFHKGSTMYQVTFAIGTRAMTITLAAISAEAALHHVRVVYRATEIYFCTQRASLANARN